LNLPDIAPCYRGSKSAIKKLAPPGRLACPPQGKTPNQRFENCNDLILVKVLLKVNLLLDILGYASPDDEYPHKFSCLFVSIKDSVNIEVFAYEGSVPNLY